MATGKVDLAIVEFKVPSSFSLNGGDDHRRDDGGVDSARAITINLVVENRGTVDQPKQATVTGTLNGVEVYSKSLSVSAKLGGRKSFAFPNYRPTSTGEIHWTVAIADEIPDNSTASAATTVTRPNRPGDRRDKEESDK